MWRVLSYLQTNLVWSIPISMSVGLLFGYFFDASPLKRFIIPVTFIMVYPMMVTLNVKAIFKGQDYKLQLATQIINFILVPLLAFYGGRLFFSGGPDKYGLWAVGLFLIGVLPTSGLTISWTGFAKGNKEAAIKMEERIIGSTASDVIRLRDVPVMVIRLPSELVHAIAVGIYKNTLLLQATPPPKIRALQFTSREAAKHYQERRLSS